MHQSLDELSKKHKAIALALTAKGIPIWEGLPEAVVQSLHDNGYKIKRRRRANKK
jgi:hypothetical protein